MIFICSFIFLFILFIIFMLGVSSGFIVYSKDKAIIPAKTEVKKAELKAYIDLNGNFIELLTKAEETKAKRDGYKVIYQ